MPTAMPRNVRRLWLMALPMVPSILLAVACLAGPFVAGSCTGQRRSQFWRPLRSQSLPTIRVRLTSIAIQQAEFSSSGGCRVLVDNVVSASFTSPSKVLRVSRSGGQWRIDGEPVIGDRIDVKPSPGSLLRFGEREFRGGVFLHPAGEEAFHVVNFLDAESYLAGVLSEELYPHWSVATYEAQAIAARTFAIYTMNHRDIQQWYDVVATQASQVYGGASAESGRAWSAVRRTHGKVLTYGPTGQEKMFLAQYSASNGGYVNGVDVIRSVDEIMPFRGGQRDARDNEWSKRYRWPAVKISKADIHLAITERYKSARALTDVSKVIVVETTSYGVPVWLDIFDSAGKNIRIRAYDLRSCLQRVSGRVAGGGAIRSINCKIRDIGDSIEFYDGRGFGHGVGLSQWGAEAKARRNWPAEKILQFYYPGAKVLEMY